MTRLKFVAALGLALLIAPAARPAAAQSPDDAFNKAYSEAEKRFDQRYEAAEAVFGKAVAAADDADGKASMDALKKFRTVDYQDYLQWIDAEQMLDFQKLAQLAKEVPAAAEYMRATDATLKKHADATATAYASEQAALTKAYEDEQAEQTAAYRAVNPSY